MYAVGIIGAGNIAQCLKRRLENMGHKVLFILRSTLCICDGTELQRNNLTLKELIDGKIIPIPQVVFIAIPTLKNDEGKSALKYILDCVELHIPVVTCEKGSPAYHYSKLFAHANKIGFTATVGGGTQMLRFLRDRQLNMRSSVQIDAVVNGTLNFIFDEVSRGGRTLGEACGEAVHLGYAEPGARNPTDLINGELQDITMKTCVLYNTVLADNTTITPNNIGFLHVGAKDLENLGERAGRYRFIVSFTKGQVRNPDFFGGICFTETIEAWRIQGGFRDTHQDPELLSWLPSGVGNAAHVTEGELGAGGKYHLSGPGAGAEPTATAMINDMLRLLEQ